MIVDTSQPEQTGPKPKRSKLCIVGFAGTTRDQVPYKDDSFDIWSLNNAWQFVPRWDRWFEMHSYETIVKDFKRGVELNRGADHMKWLTEQQPGRPIYMQKALPEVPASVPFPRDEVNDWFRRYTRADAPILGAQLTCEPQEDGYFASDYYTSSIAEMLALAIAEGYKEIHVYGVDMLQSEEYYYQRSGCEYYIAFARGRGIRMYVPMQSALCTSGYTYGYTEPPPENLFEPIIQFAAGKADQSSIEMNKLLHYSHTHDGARQAFLATKEQLVKSNGSMTGDDLVKWLDAQAENSFTQFHKFANGAALHDGARQMALAHASWIKHFGMGGMLKP